MKRSKIFPVAVLGLLFAAPAAFAQSDSIYGSDPTRYLGYPNQTNAVVSTGSGAVKPLGAGQDRNTAGIGGSATSAPQGAVYDPSSTDRVVTTPPATHRTHHVMKHRNTQHG
jgi:hypothetical protein